MKSLISAFAFAVCLAAAPAWAEDASQGPSSENTYATMFAYSQVSPHARRVPDSVEKTAEMKAAEAERAQVAAWSTTMGRGDVPQEYLGSGHK